MSKTTTDPNFPLSSRKVVLQLERITATRNTLKEYREWDAGWPARVAGDLTHQLDEYIASEHLIADRQVIRMKGTDSTTVPTTWWDHFKDEQVKATSPFWRWVARRWPPKMTTLTFTVEESREVTFRAKALYPYSTIEIPELGRSLIVETWDNDLLRRSESISPLADPEDYP